MLKVPKLFPLAVVLLMVGCDHGTKHLAKLHLEGKSAVPVVPGVFDLRYTENTDTAFSLLGSWVEPHIRHPLLVGVKLAVVTGLLAFVLARWARLGSWERAGALMALAGGLGNLIDRFARGYVIDFLRLRYWPVFNVADIVITIGAVLFAMGMRQPTKPAPGLPASAGAR
jgi:signal peptidase II